MASIADQSLSLTLSVRMADLQLLESVVKTLQEHRRLVKTRTIRLGIREWVMDTVRQLSKELVAEGLMQPLANDPEAEVNGTRVVPVKPSTRQPFGAVVPVAEVGPNGRPVIHRAEVLDPKRPAALPEELQEYKSGHDAVTRSLYIWFGMGYYTPPAAFTSLAQPADHKHHIRMAAGYGATLEYMQAAAEYNNNPGKYDDYPLDPQELRQRNQGRIASAPAPAPLRRPAPIYHQAPPTPQEEFPAHWNEAPSAEEEARAHRVLDEISRNDALTARKARIDAEDAAERQRQRDATPEEDPFDTDAQWRAAGLNPDPLAPT